MIFLKYLAAGLLGGVILIVLAKWVAAPLMQRDETYYDESEEGGGEKNV